MEDSNQPSTPPGSGEPEEEHTEDKQEAKGAADRSRLDRLINAKEDAERVEKQWSELEQRGTPLPSADSPPEEKPVLEEPARQPGDTPVERATPPEGTPRPDLPETPERRSKRDRPVPSFPHPTDPVPPPVPRPVMQGGKIVEPPRPDPLSEGADTPGAPQRVEPPHRQYEPPPDRVGGVRVDADGMPLPKSRGKPYEDPDATLRSRPQAPDPSSQETMRHPPIDRGVTRQPPSAQGQAGRVPPPPPPPPPASTRPAYPAARPSQAVSPPARQARPGSSKRRKAKARRKPQDALGCLLRAGLLGFVSIFVLGLLLATVSAIYYSQVTAPVFANIKTIDDLQARALQFETTRIRDRDGNILYQINDPEGGLRDTVRLSEVSPYVITATVATEEREFFTNPGFSIPAIIRAVIRNYQEGEVVSGASTITQQLTRALLLPEEERARRTYDRKIKEIFLAAELGRRFTKEEILELYLNQIYYGNLAYGIEAASRTYFNKSASELTLAEASFLAGLPQAPAIYDPVNNREGALERQQQVISLMLEGGCINTGSTGLQLPCTTAAEIAQAQPEIAQIATTEFQAPVIQARYPHWVVYIQQLLEADPRIGPAIYTSGFDVYTTLDPRLQDLAQQQVEQTLLGLADRNVNNASVVVIDIDTGAILAMVGSRNFNDESIDGQVNIPLTPQQPGSSIKPFTYIAALRQGWTPATVIWDVPIQYEIPGFGIYEPINYDGRYHGPVTVRAALANSYNIPAVLTLDHVGVSALLKVLNDVGITSLGDSSNPNNYGLSLTLGAGEVYLLEWTNAFATIGNGGVYRPTYGIERIEKNGQVIEGYPYEVPQGVQAIDPDHAFLIASILSDGEARIPAFGSESVLTTPYPAGAKTGTTNDFRDNWTMGFTSEIAVGVWVGNTDNSPMINVSGVTGAGPIWRGIMDAATQWYAPREFPRPNSVFRQTICPDDGTSPPSEFCTDHVELRDEWFSVKQQPPPPEQGIYRSARVDPFTGLIANQYCDEYAVDRFFIVLPNPSNLIDASGAARNWLLNTEAGRFWAEQRGIPPEQLQQFVSGVPTAECAPDTQRPNVAITSPPNGSEQAGLIPIVGSAIVPNFSHYEVEFGISDNPQGWGTVQGRTSIPIDNNVLAQVDLTGLADGPITLRVLVYDQQGNVAEARSVIYVKNPTPTPTPTGAPTATPTATLPAPTPEAPTPEVTP